MTHAKKQSTPNKNEFETLNPKFETIAKGKSKKFNRARFVVRVLRLGLFPISIFEFRIFFH